MADIATGSADGMVRVFTPDLSRALQGDKLVEVEEILRYGGDGSAVTPLPLSVGSSGLGFEGGLPLISEMGVMVGKVDGQISAFADDETGDAKVSERHGRAIAEVLQKLWSYPLDGQLEMHGVSLCQVGTFSSTL